MEKRFSCPESILLTGIGVILLQWEGKKNDQRPSFLSLAQKRAFIVTSAERFGIEKGVRKGRRDGKREGSFTTLYALVRNAAQSGLSHKVIADIAGIETADVGKILNNEPIELPAHLLKPPKIFRAVKMPDLAIHYQPSRVVAPNVKNFCADA